MRTQSKQTGWKASTPHIKAIKRNALHRARSECAPSEEKFREIESLFPENGLRVSSAGRTRPGENMVCRWEVYGRPQQHERLVEKLFAHADVKEFHW